MAHIAKRCWPSAFPDSIVGPEQCFTRARGSFSAGVNTTVVQHHATGATNASPTTASRAFVFGRVRDAYTRGPVAPGMPVLIHGGSNGSSWRDAGRDMWGRADTFIVTAQKGVRDDGFDPSG